MSCNNCYQKSAQCAYNNATQTVVAAGTTLAVLGVQACDTGVSIDTDANGFSIMHGGLYRFSFDATVNSVAGGDAVMQLYNGSNALACANASATIEANGTGTLHAETVLRMGSCCGNRPHITAVMSGVVGTVTHVCANAVKLA